MAPVKPPVTQTTVPHQDDTGQLLPGGRRTGYRTSPDLSHGRQVTWMGVPQQRIRHVRHSVCPLGTINSHVCHDMIKDCWSMDLLTPQDERHSELRALWGSGGGHCKTGSIRVSTPVAWRAHALPAFCTQKQSVPALQARASVHAFALPLHVSLKLPPSFMLFHYLRASFGADSQ